MAKSWQLALAPDARALVDDLRHAASARHGKGPIAAAFGYLINLLDEIEEDPFECCTYCCEHSDLPVFKREVGLLFVDSPGHRVFVALEENNIVLVHFIEHVSKRPHPLSASESALAARVLK